MKAVRLALLFLLILRAGLLWSDVPVREEQLIYTILAFNGKDYANTFARQDADTIYLMADADNFLTVRKTFVYYWPLSGDWNTESSTLDIALDGSLELSFPDGRVQTIRPTPYTYYNVRGAYEVNWKVDRGQEAFKAWERYQHTLNAYYASAEEYNAQLAIYEATLDELVATITAMRDQGKDVSKLVNSLAELSPPKKPPLPTDYIVPPVPVQLAFILNLPVGEYSIRFLHVDGRVIEGSERTVVVFEKRRAQGIGIEVIPADKWTRPVESRTPASVLYVDGSTDLYLRPFFEQEYNDLFYQKMSKNDAKGNPQLMRWVRIQQVPKARLLIARSGQPAQTVSEAPYYVEQTEGASLGYRIVPYDPQGAHKDTEPSLLAFHVPVGSQQRVIRMLVQDQYGTTLHGSERQIRMVRPSGSGTTALALALLPIVVMTLVLIRRARIHWR
jgi:hypothetical protein